jgi:hypothetical protein
LYTVFTTGTVGKALYILCLVFGPRPAGAVDRAVVLKLMLLEIVLVDVLFTYPQRFKLVANPFFTY